MPGVGAKPKKDIHKLGTCDFIEAQKVNEQVKELLRK